MLKTKTFNYRDRVLDFGFVELEPKASSINVESIINSVKESLIVVDTKGLLMLDFLKRAEIFLNQNQHQSIDNSSCLYFEKQNPNINSKVVIPFNIFSENSNIPKTMENSVLSGKVSKEYTLRKPCSLEDIRNILKKNKISQNIIEKVKDSSTDLDKQNVGYFVVKVKGTRQIKKENTCH